MLAEVKKSSSKTTQNWSRITRDLTNPEEFFKWLKGPNPSLIYETVHVTSYPSGGLSIKDMMEDDAKYMIVIKSEEGYTARVDMNHGTFQVFDNSNFEEVADGTDVGKFDLLIF